MSPSRTLLRGKYERWALRLLREGATPRHVVETTGIPMERLRQLAAEQPHTRITPNPHRHPCTTPGCGQPRTTRGIPGKHWVKVKAVAMTDALWFCGWDCLLPFAYTGQASA